VSQEAVITEEDRALARKCVQCPLCTRARTKQRGPVFWFVKNVEGGVCPACQAYERVYGRKAHEPLPKRR
jgi:Zn ribbon nucleic-acid-binding protein